MLYHLAAILVSLLAFVPGPTRTTQVSGDWHKRFGAPQSERYILHDGTSLTVVYSQEGRTCKALIESPEPDSERSAAHATENRIYGILREVIPLGERGREIRSIGLMSSVNGIGSMEYERVTISVVQKGSGAASGPSAIVRWNGVKCRPPDDENPETH